MLLIEQTNDKSLSSEFSVMLKIIIISRYYEFCIISVLLVFIKSK